MRKADRFLKRAMSVVVTGAMVLSIMPATIYAEGEPAEAEVENEAVNEAVAEAAEGVRYVTMNVPYHDLYEAMGLDVSEDGKYYYDTVTTATTRFFYKGSGVSKGSYNNAVKDEDGNMVGDILGATYPVAVSEEDYQTLSEKAKTEDYYIEDYEGTPESYLTAEYDEESGKWSFSADTIEDRSDEVTDLKVSDVTTESEYGDYEFELENVYTNPQEGSEVPGVRIGTRNGLSIAGVILTIDGERYGMGMLENTWVGSERKYVEIAWSVPEGKGLTNHGGNPFKTFDTNGGRLTEVEVITDQGLYTIGCDQELTPYYSGEGTVTADIVDPATLEIEVPEGIEAPKVTVSYKAPGGRHGTIVNVAENADIVEGKVALKDVTDFGFEYTVTVASENYGPIIKKTSYGDENLVPAMMNIPYHDFYEALNVDVSKNGEYCYDTVSTATTRFFASGTGTSKGTYNNAEKDAEGNVIGGDILGVTYPVAIPKADYDVLSQKTNTEDYYVAEYTGIPTSYMTVVKYENGKCSFSADAVKDRSDEVSNLSVSEVTTGSEYGDYQIDLENILTTSKTESGEDISGAIIGDRTNLSISGVIMTIDNKRYGMGMLENIWVGTRVPNVEVAWSVPEGKGLKNNHGNGNAFKTFNTNGGKLTKVEVITDQGSYTIDCDRELTPYYAAKEEVTAKIVGTTLEINVPTAFENPKVAVSYKVNEEGSHHATTKYVADNADIKDGKVALTDVPTGETEYTITVSSRNYGPVVIPLTYKLLSVSKVTLNNKNATYTGKAIAIGTAVVTGSTGSVTYKYYSDKACKKAVAASNVKNAGTYYVKATVAADNNYNAATSNTATLTIKKAAQQITKAVTLKTIKSKKLKKKAQSFSIGAKATAGKVTYNKTSGNKKIKVSSAGKVKVAKGLKKGTYKIKVKIKAKATTNYTAKTQTKTIKINVK